MMHALPAKRCNNSSGRTAMCACEDVVTDYGSTILKKPKWIAAGMRKASSMMQRRMYTESMGAESQLPGNCGNGAKKVRLRIDLQSTPDVRRVRHSRNRGASEKGKEVPQQKPGSDPSQNGELSAAWLWIGANFFL